jgi:carbonic anhydrase/acetyltransferase-like protein (isoleucine patch superfamily)
MFRRRYLGRNIEISPTERGVGPAGLDPIIREFAMPLYELDGHRVRRPASGRCWIAPSAELIGRVTLGEDTGIWFNAVIRGDNEPIVIGDKTNIQENSVLHVDPGFPMEIGERVTVGHLCMLHGCTIGSGSLIGMGAIVLNGARIGEDCLIGAGTLIPEGKVIPPRSLVMGAPFKIVRECSPANLALLEQSWQVYVDRARMYADRMRPQAG